MQWVLNGYVLALASLTLIGGALADAHGKARMLALGCLLFGAASAACALAPVAAWLIAARVVQGIAAALVTPASLALIGATYPQEERNRAIGVWAAASALDHRRRPGARRLADRDVRLAGRVLDQSADRARRRRPSARPSARRTGFEPRRFDIVGAAIIAAALAALAWALSRIGAQRCAIRRRLVGVTIVDRGRARPRRACRLRLLGARDRSSDDAAAPRPATAPSSGSISRRLLIYGGLAIMFFLLPFDLVDRRGLPPTDAGLVFLPFTLAVGLLSRVFGGLADKMGARTMLMAGPLGAALAYVVDGARPGRLACRSA